MTGANGQLGKELRLLAREHTDIDFFFQSREDMPLENFEMIRTVFGVIKPDVFINCAAYTNVDKAESEKEIAELTETARASKPQKIVKLKK